MKQLIVITDPGKYLDDENMLVLAARLARLGKIELLAVVANLAPAVKRAQLAAGTLKLVGLGQVPVGIGTACGASQEGHEQEFDQVPYLAPADQLLNGSFLLVSALYAAADKSVTLLLVSGLTDAANLLREQEKLVKQKVERVVIMGGVVEKDDAVVLDAQGFMTPDGAANNSFDRAASEFFYRKVQEIGIPMTILSRHASEVCKVPRAMYDEMSATGNQIGVKLRDSQSKLSDSFWRQVNLPVGHPGRAGVTERWNRQLFLDNYCGGEGADRRAEDSVADLVKHLVLSDPMTLLACDPELCERFFTPYAVTVMGVEHSVIGVSPRVSCVKDAKAVVDYLCMEIPGALVADSGDSQLAQEAPAEEENAAAQKWFLEHQEELPKAKYYAVGADGLIAHGEELQAVVDAVVKAGRSPADKSLLFACLCGPEGCSVS